MCSWERLAPDPWSRSRQERAASVGHHVQSLHIPRREVTKPLNLCWKWWRLETYTRTLPVRNISKKYSTFSTISCFLVKNVDLTAEEHFPLRVLLNFLTFSLVCWSFLYVCYTRLVGSSVGLHREWRTLLFSFRLLTTSATLLPSRCKDMVLMLLLPSLSFLHVFAFSLSINFYTAFTQALRIFQ